MFRNDHAMLLELDRAGRPSAIRNEGRLERPTPRPARDSTAELEAMALMTPSRAVDDLSRFALLPISRGRKGPGWLGLVNFFRRRPSTDA